MEVCPLKKDVQSPHGLWQYKVGCTHHHLIGHTGIKCSVTSSIWYDRQTVILPVIAVLEVLALLAFQVTS